MPLRTLAYEVRHPLRGVGKVQRFRQRSHLSVQMVGEEAQAILERAIVARLPFGMLGHQQGIGNADEGDGVGSGAGLAQGGGDAGGCRGAESQGPEAPLIDEVLQDAGVIELGVFDGAGDPGRNRAARARARRAGRKYIRSR